MAEIKYPQKKNRGVAVLALVASVAVLAGAGVYMVSRGSGFTSQAGLKSTGQAQLMSVEQLPEDADGMMCESVPAKAGSSLVAAMQQQRMFAAKSPADIDESKRDQASKRPPTRTIKDPWGAYSAVAIDPKHNEVLMTDENLFRIVAYDRMENTPPKASLTEPKRSIQGEDTEIEFQCSIYIDPESGDVYAVNNDTLGKMAVFPYGAKGNVKPARYLESPMSTFGIAVSEKHQEMLFTIQDDAAVITFKKTAVNHDSPVRTIQGDHTGLADPHGIVLNEKSDRVYVSNWGSTGIFRAPASGKWRGTLNRGVGRENYPVGRDNGVPGSGKFTPPSITVYPRDASWDVAPLQTIQGPKTQLNWPTSLSLDIARNELYVANDPSHSILVFKGDATGDVAPIRVIKGPNSMIKNPTSVFVDEAHQELWVANFGNHNVTVYPLGVSGDPTPKRIIRSGPLDAPAPMMGNPHTVTYDSKRDQILVAN